MSAPTSISSKESSSRKWKRVPLLPTLFASSKKKDVPIPPTDSNPSPPEPIPEDAEQIDELIDLLLPKDSPQDEISLEFALRLRCAEKALEFARKEPNKKYLGRKGMRAFVLLLGDPKKAVHLYAVQIIRVLVTVGELKGRFRESNGFPPLLRLFTESEDVQKNAVASLGFLLTNDAQNADTFVECGGVEPLINLLKSPNDTIQFMAAGVTWVLASYEEKRHQDVVRLSGGLSLLLSLLESSNPDIQWQASGALRLLSLNNQETQKELIEKSILKILLKQVIISVTEKVTGHLLAAILALAHLREIQDQFRESGKGFEHLLQIFKNPETSTPIKDLCVGIISNISYNNIESQRLLLKMSCIDLLVSLLRDTQGLNFTASNALHPLLVQNEEIRRRVEELGGLTDMLELLLYPIKQEKTFIATINNIRLIVAASSPNIPVFKITYISRLVQQLNYESIGVLETVSALLVEISRKKDNLELMMDADLLQTLLSNLNSDVYPIVEISSSLFREILLKYEEGRTKAVQLLLCSRTLQRLISFVPCPRPNLQLNSALILRVLSSHDEQLAFAIVISGGPRAIYTALVPTTPAEIIIEILKLAHELLIKNPKTQIHFKERGVVHRLVEMLQGQAHLHSGGANFNLSEVIFSLETLSALSHNNQKIQEVVRGLGGIPSIVSFLQYKDSLALLKTVVRTLTVLFQSNGKAQEAARQSGVVEELLSLINSEDTLLQISTIEALYILALKNTKVQTHIEAARGGEDLVRGLNRLSVETNETAVIQIVGLLGSMIARRSLSFIQRLREANVEETFSSLQKNPSISPSLKIQLEAALNTIRKKP